MKINIAGLDPSLNNLGTVRATLDIDTLEVAVISMELIETDSQSAKTVRKNSDDLRRATILSEGLRRAVKDCPVAFCEVPVGSQSARAMASYGICIGILAGCPVPLIQLTPFEVKIAAVNHREAAKEEMIDWAVAKHPNAPWLRDVRRGGKLLNKNEHLADALASIYAGIRTSQFDTLVRMLRMSTGVSA